MKPCKLAYNPTPSSHEQLRPIHTDQYSASSVKILTSVTCEMDR